MVSAPTTRTVTFTTKKNDCNADCFRRMGETRSYRALQAHPPHSDDVYADGSDDYQYEQVETKHQRYPAIR